MKLKSSKKYIQSRDFASKDKIKQAEELEDDDSELEKDKEKEKDKLKNESTSAIKGDNQGSCSKSVDASSSESKNQQECKTLSKETEEQDKNEDVYNKNLVISASELVKLKNARSSNKSPPNDQTISNDDLNDNQYNESKEQKTVKNHHLTNSAKNNYPPSNLSNLQNELEKTRILNSSNSKHNSISRVDTQSRDLEISANDQLIDQDSLDHDLSFNVMNFSNLINPNSNSSGNNHNSKSFNHIYKSNSLINVVNPMISTVNRNTINQITNSSIINHQSNLIQTVPSINVNSVSNRPQSVQNVITILDQDEIDEADGSYVRYEQSEHDTANRQPQLNFQEASESILSNSKRLIRRYLPPVQFWKNNNLVNQIVITDVKNKDNVGVTIRECSSQSFFAKSSKKKKLKHKNLNKFKSSQFQ